MRNAHHPLEDGLRDTCRVRSTYEGLVKEEAYSGLVMHQQHYPVRPSLGEFLHNLRQVDDGEEVSP